MRNYTGLLSILLLLFIDAHAQLRIGLVGGGHRSSVEETNDLPNWNEIKNKYTPRTGAHFGFIADLQLKTNSRLYFQPGIIFYNKGRKFSDTYDTSVFEYSRIDAKQYINYIDFPLNLVYKIPMGKSLKFFIGAGPYLSFFYNGKESSNTYLKTGIIQAQENDDLPVGDGPGKYQTLDFGANGTAGIEFNRVFLSVNYSRGLKDFFTAAYEGNFKHQVIGGTLGIFIGKPVPHDEMLVDTDGDGIKDYQDSCVTLAGPPVTNGCPDTDADGIADVKDKCPSVQGILKYEGCPIPDTDKDGVNDEVDKCREVFGVSKYEGCPVPDTDNDGVNDEKDSCREVPGFEKYNGCPIPDRDKDGVNDEKDNCPDVPGLMENNGCPEVKQETKEKVEYAARKIQFELAKATLLPDSKKVLNEVADLLIQNPELLLDIEGHTSSEGTLKVNMELSEKRALAVKQYLVSRGVQAERLSSQGYGPSRPLNEGRTAAEKALNRRVEMKVRNN